MNTLKNVVKKAIAVSSGALVLGATTGVALADLSDYPAPFIKNGQFDGLIVVGEKAASSDIIGAIDIAASLQASATTPVGNNGGDGGTRTVLTGDVAQIGDSGDLLEVGEQIGDVTETLTEDELEMLQSGSVSTQAGTTDFTQTLDLDPDGLDATSSLVLLDENEDDEVGMFLLFESDEPVYTYEVEFTSGLESDIEVVAGGTNDVAEDLEDEQIYLMGQWYTISVAQAEGTQVELTLLAGDVSDTLTQGETKTYEIDGKEYEVTVLAIGNDGASVKFLVNGEATDSMGVDDTETLADGLELGVRDIIETTAYRESDPGSIVEFYLGANKVELVDADVTADNGAGTVEINDENIEDVDADINGVITGTTSVRINSIDLTLNVDAAEGTDVYLGTGEGLREQLDEPEGMMGNWDIVFQGLSEPAVSTIEFEANGDDEYTLQFTNNRGNTYNVPYAVATGANAVDFGDDDDDFKFYEAYEDQADDDFVDASVFHISDDDYFLVTDDHSDNSGDSYVLQFNDVDTSDSTVTFTDVATGQDITATYGTLYVDAADDVEVATAFATPSGDITIGGKDFSFWLRQVAGAGAYTLAVDMNNDGALVNQTALQSPGEASAVSEYVVNVVVDGGGILTLADDATAPAGGDWTARLVTLGEDLDNAVTQNTTITFTTDATGELDVALGAATTGTFQTQSDTDADTAFGITAYGAWFEATEQDDEADSLTISYPQEQVEALVYVVGGEAQSSTVASGGAGARVNPVGVGAAVLDRDVDYDQDNMIVVGGPCVNTMAAQLLGNPADCAEGFSEGMAMIRLFDTGQHTALLVAGYEAQDTVGASRVLAESGDYELSGNAVDVTVESLRDITVSPADEE